MATVTNKDTLMTNERYIPTEIRRALRREAYFGCAECGSPILEYHHIIPFAEEKLHRPEHMIALCPTHHRSFGKMHRKKCYDLKNNPRNKTNNVIRGLLGSDVEIDSVAVGSNIYINTPTIFSYYNKPIISYRFEDGQFLLSVRLPGKDFWPDLHIKENDVIISSNKLLDVDFKTNYLKIFREDGGYIEVDVRKNTAAVAAEFSIGNEFYKFNSSESNVGGMSIKNSTISNCGSGIGIGDGKHTIHWPNYAMIRPRATFSKTT